VGGAIQETFTDFFGGKNIGRATETTAWEQCIREAGALWQKQQDRKGYALDMSVAKQGFTPVKPMLAHSYHDNPAKLQFPCFIQPKLDGVRCLAFINKQGEVRLFSRQSKEFLILGHIVEALQALGLRNVILDGELYSHDISFQQIISGAKRDEKGAFTEKIEYHVYDLINDARYANRYSTLYDMIPSGKRIGTVQHVPTLYAKAKPDLHSLHKKLTGEGYEGIILRNELGLYTPDKRSHDLLKYKVYQSAEFQIVGVEENCGKLAGTCVFVLKTKEGTEFRAMPDGTYAERAALWGRHKGNELRNIWGTVEYFGVTTGDNPVPRFPIFKGVRNYE